MFSPAPLRMSMILSCGALLAGCAAPDVEPFADATVELRRAITESGAVTAEAMVTAARTLPSGSGADDAKEFVAIWEDRIKLVDVLVDYSDALAGIAAASAGSQRTAQGLGDSIMRLADLVPGTGAAVADGVQLGEILLRTGIQVKANRDLEEAVGSAHLALAKVAGYLVEDLNDLGILYLKASQDMEVALDDEYGRREERRAALLARRAKLRDAIIAAPNDVNVAHVRQIEELVARMEPEHQEYLQRRSTLLQDRTTTLQMFNKAKAGVRVWVRAHEELRLAMEQNRRPNVRLILSTAQEIREAVDRIRNP